MKELSHQQTVAGRFTVAAPMYEPLAQIQSRVVDKLVTLLPSVVPHRMLEVGCGTGLLTRQLVTAYPASELDAIDISSHMIQHARNSLPGNSINWIHQSISTFSSDHPYDLISSSSALHWLDPFIDDFRRILAKLAPNGNFICSLMLKDTLKELYEARMAVAPAKEPLGRLPEIETIKQIIDQQGLDTEECHAETFIERYTDGSTFLRAIHNMGLTGGKVSRSTYPLTGSELTALAQYYNTHFQHEEGGVYATYHVAFVKAKQTHQE